MANIKPGYDFLYNLVKEFHVNLYYLLFGEGEMFRSPLESVGSWDGKFSINSPDLREFLEKFERSPYVQFNVLANFRVLNFRDHEIIAQDIARTDADRGNFYLLSFFSRYSFFAAIFIVDNTGYFG